MHQVVTPIQQPNNEAMLTHVQHLFGGYLGGYQDGLIELSWTETTPDASGRHKLKNARLFGTDQLDELVEEAARLNATPMCNVYIGAALRHPHTAPFGRASDEDAWALPAVYVDLDEEGTTATACGIYGDMKPTFVVMTGRFPHNRAQLWWRLDEPMDDKAAWPAQLRGIAIKLNGDTTVCNPSRVMRLAGSIAWPVKDGRRTEATGIHELKSPGLPAYMPEHIAKVFPPIVDAAAGNVTPAAVTHSTNSLGLADRITDGREAYMRDTIMACLIEFIGENGCEPSAQDLYDLAWPQYERKVDLQNRPGRGPDEFAEKCAYTVARFARGELRGARTLDEAATTYATKKRARETAKAAGVEERPREQPLPSSDNDDTPFPATAFKGEPAKLEWLVEDWIPRGVIAALYGDGGVGKTLLAQQLLYAAGVGGKWLGMGVPKMKGLGVFCEDDRDELHRRHDAIKASLGFSVGNPFSETWIWPRVGFDNLLVTFDKDNRPTMSPFFEKVMTHVLEKRLGLLVLDTVADLFGGNEIIRTQVNFFIKSTCGAFIRKAKEEGFQLTVILLAHPSQSGRESGRGDGGSTAWSNAVRARLYLTKPSDGDQNDRSLSRKKSNYSASGDDTAIQLQWQDGVIMPFAASITEWPETDVCRQVVRAINDAWSSGIPWSSYPQTKRDGRFAPKLISRQFGLTEALAASMINKWLETRVLAVLECNGHDKMKGLKVVGSI